MGIIAYGSAFPNCRSITAGLRLAGVFSCVCAKLVVNFTSGSWCPSHISMLLLTPQSSLQLPELLPASPHICRLLRQLSRPLAAGVHQPHQHAATHTSKLPSTFACPPLPNKHLQDKDSSVNLWQLVSISHISMLLLTLQAPLAPHMLPGRRQLSQLVSISHICSRINSSLCTPSPVHTV
jgi:hypothetical protein